MTSHINDAATRKFFVENNYFNYPQDSTQFFSQDKLPVLDVEGKLLLSEPYLIKEESNGNGDVYKALVRNNLLEELRNRNIKWIFICGIDNILLKIVDPLFLGITISNNKSIASKTILKESPMGSEYVFARINGKPGILDYKNITLEMSEAKNEKGDFLYRESNVLSHLLSIDALEKSSHIELPYHRAFKKNTFINDEGMKQVPEERNSFKFEKFIFDSFNYFDDLLLFRVNKDEFAPIKDAFGLNSPAVATKLYVKNQSERLS